MDNGLILYPKNDIRMKYNSDQLQQLPNLTGYEANDEDASGNKLGPESSAVKYMNTVNLARNLLFLAPGAKVMLLRNMKNGVQTGWVNGCLCIVDACLDDSVIVHQRVRHF